MHELTQLKLSVKPTIHKVWELLNHFKNQCKGQNWKISEHEDWIRTNDGKYHNFLWVQSIQPSTFDKICADFKVAIKSNISYQVRSVSYVAWLFINSPSEELLRKVEQNSVYSKKIAIYDLSQAFTGKLLCRTLNQTGSKVFKKFERFMEEELGINVEFNKKLQRQSITSMFPALY